MDKKQFVTFRIDGHLIGINIRNVREINRNMDLSPIPLAPDYIRGLINLRGQIVTVFDLGKRLGFDNRTITPATNNIILKEDPVGLLVDSIGDVVQATKDTIVLPPASVGQIEEEFIEGVVKLEKELLVILSSQKILTHKIENI
jgi:purine-binding chemotaxis protein CheW